MPEMIDTIPAKVWRAWWDESREFFLPAALRGKFEEQARAFREQPPQFWNDRFAARHPELRSTLEELSAWFDEADCEVFLAKLDPELFFWYVLRVQAIWIGVSSVDPESPHPAPIAAFWRWANHQLDSGWVPCVFPPRWAMQRMERKPSIWEIPIPKGMESL